MSETNPYSPPNADVQRPDAAPGRFVGWIVFFAFMVLLSLFDIVTITVMPDENMGRPAESLDVVFTIFSVVGLYGFCFLRQIFNRLFWKLYVIALAGWYAWWFWADEELASLWDDNTGEAIIILSLVIPLVFFEFLALVRYAWFERQIWAPPADRENG